MKPLPYKELNVNTYTSQILQRYKRMTGCTYSFMNDEKKELIVNDIPGQPLLIIGDTWQAVAYQLNALMNTNLFMRTYRPKQRWSDIDGNYYQK